MAAALKTHRRFQAEERLAAGADWVDHDLVVATRIGRPVSPGNFDQTLERLVVAARVPRLTSHGLRHTAATHMVRHASDIGEIRAAADILGHSPDMLMRTYAHALPESISTVTDKIERRSRGGFDDVS
jgi:integrase